MSQVNNSMSLSNPHPANFNAIQKLGLAIVGIGALALFLAWAGLSQSQPLILLSLTLFGLIAGGIIYTLGSYANKPDGIKNNRVYFSNMSARGALAWIAGIVFTGFYIALYFRQNLLTKTGIDFLGGLIKMFNPLSMAFKGEAATEWFVYGSFYTLAVLIMGFKFIFKYRHNRYQIIRTCSVMFFQLIFAYTLPFILYRLQNYEAYVSYFWPLAYQYFFPDNISYLIQHGNIGLFLIAWGFFLSFLATPVLTYFIGKRWYCSWVCGCGGLAETAGDPYRHLSDKSLKAWRIERVLIYSVLAIIILITLLLLIDTASQGNFLGITVGRVMAKSYGILIGMIFSGVVGVGFYPIMGNRVWCRFGCPMAAYIGLIQRFKSRFRITANGGQCISCGNCSTYCEMGIDVRWYAQRGQNIVRASCVGCGVCAAVCPRGVLKLENGPVNTKRTAIQMSTLDLIPPEEVKIL